MYTREDIIASIRQAADEATDDCQYSGVLTLGAIILGVSEDTVMEMIADRREENE